MAWQWLMIKQMYSGFFQYTSTIVPVTLSKVKLCTGGKLKRQNIFHWPAENLCGSGFAIFP